MVQNPWTLENVGRTLQVIQKWYQGSHTAHTGDWLLNNRHRQTKRGRKDEDWLSGANVGRSQHQDAAPLKWTQVRKILVSLGYYKKNAVKWIKRLNFCPKFLEFQIMRGRPQITSSRGPRVWDSCSTRFPIPGKQFLMNSSQHFGHLYWIKPWIHTFVANCSC